jgi:hypothetical protein
VKEIMGTWLGKLVPWDAFASWTFSRPVSEQGAMYVARRHLRWVEKRAGVPVYAWLGTERGDSGGLVHLHGLIGNVAHLTFYCRKLLPPDRWGLPCCLLHAWPAGYARVLRYDPALGARHYVSKYVVKRLAEWELFGFPAIPQLALAQGGE